MLQGHSFSYRDYALALTTRTLDHIADQNWQTPLWSDYGQYEPGRVDEIVARESNKIVVHVEFVGDSAQTMTRARRLSFGEKIGFFGWRKYGFMCLFLDDCVSLIRLSQVELWVSSLE